jgi:thioredoxin-like negative regulator of GroEL
VLHLFLWPAAATVLVEAAEFYAAEGERDEAERLLTAILAEDPTATPAVLRLAALYVAAGRTGDARALLEQAARRLPDDERVRRALTDLPEP